MTNHHTRKIIAATLAALFTGNTYAQEAVIDVAAIEQAAQQVAAWGEQHGQMIEQITTMGNQLAQLKQTYDSLNGNRNLGTIMNNPALRNYLPQDWQKVYDGVKQGGYAGLTGTAKTMYKQVYDGCKHIAAEDERLACEASAVKGAQDKGFAMDAYDKAQGRMDQIEQLMAEVNNTQDPKAIAELQARIATEQANIQNEQTKLQMYAMVAAAEDRLQEQGRHELNAKANARRGWIQPQVAN